MISVLIKDTSNSDSWKKDQTDAKKKLSTLGKCQTKSESQDLTENICQRVAKNLERFYCFGIANANTVWPRVQEIVISRTETFVLTYLYFSLAPDQGLQER